MPERDHLIRFVQPLRNGQITIPAEFRRRLGITAGTILQLTLDGRELRIRPLEARETAAGSPWFRQLYDEFAPVRDEARSFEEAEIDAAIDQAVTAVRDADARRP